MWEVVKTLSADLAVKSKFIHLGPRESNKCYEIDEVGDYRPSHMIGGDSRPPPVPPPATSSPSPQPLLLFPTPLPLFPISQCVCEILKIYQ